MWTRFIELAGEINTRMPGYVVSRLEQALAEEKKTLNGAKVLVLGLSYKADIDDDRESPSYEIIELLQERGAEVAYCDPHIPAAHAGPQARPGAEVGAAHRRGVRQVRRGGALDRPRRLQRPGSLQDVHLLCDTRAAVEPPEGCRYIRA